ncbi:hypothetical protein GCM10027592_04550 [Spirosoma flavus]
MKTTGLLLLLMSLSFSVYAQIKAVTDKGDEVLLYANGTWKYSKDTEPATTEISTNPIPFKRSTSADFLLKSNRASIGFWLNPQKWTFKKGAEGEAAEYKLQAKNGDLYGMIIAEKIQVPLNMLKNIALKNARVAAPDIQLQQEEYRTVNGQRVLHLKMTGTIEGIVFTYYSYNYSDAGGTIQFLVYSSEKLMQQNQAVAEELLNGLVKLP